MVKIDIKEIEKDFKAIINEDILAILLVGSFARNEETKRSDIDICIVCPKAKNKDFAKKLFRKVLREVAIAKKNYDVLIFETLPLKFKNEIIQSNKIIWTKDRLELSEYFYRFRKLWKDVKIRRKLLGI